MYILLIIAEIFSMVLAIEIYTISPYCRTLSTTDAEVTMFYASDLIDAGFPGSVKVDIKDYPYMGFIDIGRIDKMCAGIFVTDIALVTDLGCIEDRWFNRKRRLLANHGQPFLGPRSGAREIGQYVKDYIPGGDRPNLAVVRTVFSTYKVDSADYYDVIPKYTGQWKLNQTCMMLGYGNSAGPYEWKKTLKSKYYLHKAQLNIVDISECEHLLKNTTVDREAYICAKHPQGKVRGCYVSKHISVKLIRSKDTNTMTLTRFHVPIFYVNKQP